MSSSTGSIAREGSRTDPATGSDRPLVSFIIPVRNDAARLRDCLTTIRANTYPSARVEIVVADNGSTDDSPAVARALGARVVDLPGLSVAALRNAAAAEARGDVLAFVDADHLLDPSWIASAVEHFDDERVAAVGAMCLPPPNPTWVQRMYDGLRGRTSGQEAVEWLGSGNMAVRRRDFDRVGGFDVGLETCEDVDLCRRLRLAKQRLVGDERLKNVHLGDPATLGKLFRGELWRGRDNLRVSLREDTGVSNLPSVLIPVIDLVSLVVVAISLVMAPFTGRASLLRATGAMLLPLAFAGLRTLKIVANGAVRNPLDLLRAFIVACTYDAARALAIFMRARHHRPRDRQA